MADNEQSEPKHTLVLSDEEVFYLQTALEVSLDRNRESGEDRMADIGEGIWARLPHTSLTWRDLQ